MAADKVRALRSRMGSYHSVYGVAIKAVFPDTDPDRVWELNGRVESLEDGNRFNVEFETERVWFPDAVSPAEIVMHREKQVFDGERHIDSDLVKGTVTRSRHGRLPAKAPSNLWFRTYAKKLEDVLTSPGATSLGMREFDGEQLLLFEIPVPARAESGKFHRIWLDADRNYFPVCMQTGSFTGNDVFVVSSMIHHDDMAVDGRGVPYPKHSVQSLFMELADGRRICYTERVYTCTSFQSHVAIDEDSFAFDVAPKNRVTNKTSLAQ